MPNPSITYICPSHPGCQLQLQSTSTKANPIYSCAKGCRYMAKRGIYRFVESQGYSSSFGLQWRKYRRTQLDSNTKTTLSEDRLTRCLGGDVTVVRGKRVLEAGCGAGRFTEILLREGANVMATDLSSAVEANYRNFKGYQGYDVVQANIMALPFAPAQFDVVICLGVLQHTPSPEDTIRALVNQVKPGGMLVIDHYLRNAHSKPAQLFWRPILLRLPSSLSFAICKTMVFIFWPFHRIAYLYRGKRGIWRITQMLERFSPLQDYQGCYDFGAKNLRQWAMLDTHDALTDYYKHGRSKEDILACLERNSLIDIKVWSGGNGVEANARKAYA